MPKSLNEWKGIGNIGQSPEITYMPNGNAVAKLSLACSEEYKDKNGNKVEQTNWVPVVAFGKLAEIIGKYCSQGSKIYICGKFVTRSWTDDAGVKKYKTEIVASDMLMLDGKTDRAPDAAQQDYNQAAAPQRPAPQAPAGFDEFDSIPF